MAEETYTEYRVVGDRPKADRKLAVIRAECEFGEAEVYRDLYKDDSAVRHVRIQKRTVTTTPWEDTDA